MLAHSRAPIHHDTSLTANSDSLATNELKSAGKGREQKCERDRLIDLDKKT